MARRTAPFCSRPASRRGLLVLGAGVLFGCSGPVDVEVRQLRVTPDLALVLVDDTQPLHVDAFGEGGAGADSDGVVWTSGDPTVATVGTGGTVRGLAAGTTVIVARLGQVVDTAFVEVYAPPSVGTYEPGVQYFGRRDYVEYVPGELPVILSAPHGGLVAPSEIPNRSGGERVSDLNTLALTWHIRDALVDLTGYAPHVIVSHLDRAKLDPNREIVEAAEGHPFAERAWTEYHDFIDEARSTLAQRGEGLYLDVHGHGHAVQRVELGYLLTADDLNRSDASLSAISVILRSSIRELGRDSPLPFAELLRGPTSFGGYLEAGGVPVVPGPADPGPGDDPYFAGGYSTLRHGSLFDTQPISGIQLEHHLTGLRDSDANMRAYAAVLAGVIRAYVLEHIGYFEPQG